MKPSPFPAVRPYPLLGLDPEQLWPLTNLVLPAWLLLAFLPSWRRTMTLSLLPALIYSVLYAICIADFFTSAVNGPPDFTTLSGVVRLFQDPNGVFAGWLHYLAFDLLLGRWMVQDSQARGCSLVAHVLFVIPCLLATLMAGPAGFILYVIVSCTVLPRRTLTKID
ncbi:hypothetical protein AB1Y20_017534 [Prymnesium parvum]|uniref:DUF4281 domain-containing protein n=1 Tax=Prymnesium parvum TaxID=97485 RepID=A0AB34JPM8_PRYPA